MDSTAWQFEVARFGVKSCDHPEFYWDSVGHQAFEFVDAPEVFSLLWMYLSSAPVLLAESQAESMESLRGPPLAFLLHSLEVIHSCDAQVLEEQHGGDGQLNPCLHSAEVMERVLCKPQCGLELFKEELNLPT